MYGFGVVHTTGIFQPVVVYQTCVARVGSGVKRKLVLFGVHSEVGIFSISCLILKVLQVHPQFIVQAACSQVVEEIVAWETRENNSIKVAITSNRERYT